MPFDENSWRLPEAEGLYDPSFERAACGVGFVVNIDGRRNHQVMEDASKLTTRMEHRGASGADNASGDGAGVMVTIAHELFEEELR